MLLLQKQLALADLLVFKLQIKLIAGETGNRMFRRAMLEPSFSIQDTQWSIPFFSHIGASANPHQISHILSHFQILKQLDWVKIGLGQHPIFRKKIIPWAQKICIYPKNSENFSHTSQRKWIVFLMAMSIIIVGKLLIIF